MSISNNRFRRPYLISGDEAWVKEQLYNAFPIAFSDRAVWLSNNAPKSVNYTTHKDYIDLIGRDIPFLVYDTFQGFNPDCFGLISGTVPAYGIFIMLTPPLLEWHHLNNVTEEKENNNLRIPQQKSSLFLKYFSESLISTSTFTKLNPEVSDLLPINDQYETFTQYIVNTDFSNESSDQTQAIKSITRVANGHRKRPLVLTADRGRGKTTSLGVAAARLLIERPRRIVITAPRRSAVDIAFIHAENILSSFAAELNKKKNALQFDQAEIVFIPPDVILSEQVDADLLLVDEAAALPTPILTELLKRYSRVVFSSTIHGYEGTGRGFEIKFKSILNQFTPQWRSLHMEEPIRWAAGDPLEKFVFESLLLNAEPCDLTIAKSADIDKLLFIEVSMQHLLSNQKLLVELFGLMVLAHYRTSPNDLRMMLDSPGVRLFLLMQEEHIIAATWIMEEGGLSEADALQIKQGKRRFKGHLVAQSITKHLGLMQSSTLSSARFVRVSVHPGAQSRGIGTHLIRNVVQQCSGQYDFLSSSFGATRDLVNFWYKCGFSPLRLGFKREPSSGEHALMVGYAVSTRGFSLVNSATTRFNNDFPLQLNELFSCLDVNLVAALLQEKCALPTLETSQQDIETLADFVAGYQSYDSSSVAIWRYLLSHREGLTVLTPMELQVIVKKVLLKSTWLDVVKAAGLNGKKEALAIMRSGILHIRSSVN